MRVLKLALYAFIAVIIIIIAALRFMPDEQYRRAAEFALSAAFQRTATVAGLSVHIGKTIRLRAHGVAVANAPWAPEPVMLAIDQLEAHIDLIPLWRGIMRGGMTLNGANLRIEEGADGRSNWFSATTSGNRRRQTDDRRWFLTPELTQLTITDSALVVQRQTDYSGRLDITRLQIAPREGVMQVAIDGQLDDAPLEATGSLGNIIHVLGYGADELALNGRIGANSFKLLGDWGPMLPRANANIGLTLDLQEPARLAALVGQKIAPLDALEINAAIEARAGQWRLPRLIAAFGDEQANGIIDGSIADLKTFDGVELKARTTARTLNQLAPVFGFSPPVQLPPAAKIVMSVAGKPDNTSQFSAAIHAPGIQATVNGSADGGFAVAGVEAMFTVSVDSLARLSGPDGHQLPDFGPIKTSGKLTKDGATYSLQQFNADLGNATLGGSVRGRIADIATLSGLDLAVALHARDEGDSGTAAARPPLQTLTTLMALTQFKGELPFKAIPEQITASAYLRGNRDKLRLEQIEVAARHRQTGLTMQGAVHDLLARDQGKLTFTLDSNAVTDLADFIDAPVPDLGTAQFNGELLIALGRLGGDRLNLTVANDYLTTQLKGRIDNLVELNGISLATAARFTKPSGDRSADFIQLLQSFGLTLTATQIPTRATLSSLLSGNRDALHAAGVQVTLEAEGAEATGRGHIDNLLTLDTVNLELEGMLSAGDYLAAFGWQPPTPLPPTAFHATISRRADNDGHNAITAQLTADGLTLQLDGEHGNRFPDPGATLNINLEADSLTRFGFLTTDPLPDLGPVQLTGRVTAADERFSLPQFDLMLARHRASGHLELLNPDSARKNYLLKGIVDIAALDLSPYFPLEAETATAVTEAETATADNPAGHLSGNAENNPEVTPEAVDIAAQRLFPDTALPLRPLQAIDTDLELRFAQLTLHQMAIDRATVAVKLADGVALIEPAAQSADGYLKGDIRLDTRVTPARFALNTRLRQFPIPHIGGKADLNAELTGDGQSVAAIMAGLDGDLLLVMRDGVVAKSLVSNFGSGLFSFSSQGNRTGLECGAISVTINDGLADFDKQLAAQFTGVTWIGGGTVNLKNEKIRIKIVPKGRRGIPTGSNLLAEIVDIGGTINNPQILLNPADVTLAYGKYLAYVGTGGLSLLAETLYDMFKANQDVCAQIQQQYSFKVGDDTPTQP